VNHGVLTHYTEKQTVCNENFNTNHFYQLKKHFSFSNDVYLHSERFLTTANRVSKMPKWSKETYKILGFVVLLVGLQFMSIQKLVLTKETTVFLARQFNHPKLASVNALEQLTGAADHVPPMQVNVWQWFGRSIALAGGIVILRNLGKN